MAPAQVNQSIIKGFEVLQEVISLGVPVGSREVARRLSMEHSKANRILGTLEATGMLARNDEGKYSVGPGIHVLSALSLHASGLIPAALPVLRRFQRQGGTVALGVRWRSSVAYLLHARPGQSLPRSAGAHDFYPANESILGGVLSPLSEERVVPRTESRTSYQRRLETGEHAWAASIPGTVSAGIAVVAPEGSELSSDPSLTTPAVKRAAEEIGAALLSGGG